MIGIGQGNVGEIVDHHIDLVLTLGNDVIFRSWHRNCDVHIALAVTNWGWQN
jgi:inorganic pyrophosphatase/exopolyphosphatase